MVKLSQQLRRDVPQRPTRTERIKTRQRGDLLKRLESGDRQRLQSKVDQASEKFKDISYEDYETEYQKLDTETKQFFTSPERLKTTQGYQSYLKQRTEYQAELKTYEDAQRNRREWEQAQKIVLEGNRYDPQSPVGRKVNQIYRKGGKVAILGIASAREPKPTFTDELGQGISIAPELYKKDAPSYSFNEFGQVISIAPELTKPDFTRPKVNFEQGIIKQQKIRQDPTSPFLPTKEFAEIGDRKWYEKNIQELIVQPAKRKVKAGGKGIKKGFEYVDERVHFDLTPSPSFPKLTVTYGKREDPTIPEQAVELGIGKLEGMSDEVKEWAIGKGRIEELDLKLKDEFQGKYQTAFDEKYMDALISGKTTFEDASTKFEESAEAEKLQKEFAEKYGTEYKTLSQETKLMKKLLGGSAIAGLGLGKMGLKAIKTPTRTLLTAGAVYTGVGIAGAIPTHVALGTSATFGAYGTYKAFSPTSTIEEAGGGLLTAGVSFATLGFAGYKQVRSPVIKSVKIQQPKLNLKASEIIGKDVKLITDQGTMEKVIFQEQKLSQIGTAGRRTIVTTKGRKFLKLDKAIFEGVPYKDPKGYQKALKRLKKYGYTDPQARATLRYTSPKITEQILKKGVISIKGEKALGEFEHLTKRPVIDIDETLGIKTRGAKTIKDITKVERKLIDFKGKDIVAEERTQLSLLLKKGKIFDVKDLSLTRGLSFGKSTELKKGYELLGTDELKILKEAKIRDLYDVSISQKVLPSEKIINIDTTRTRLISKIVDNTIKQYRISPQPIKKTPLSKTFGTGEVADIKKIIRTKPTQQVNKVIDKIENSQVQLKLSPKEMQGFELQQLKSAPTPKLKIKTDIKDLVKIKQLDKMAGVKVGSGVNIKMLLGTKADLKSTAKLKQNIKSMINLKDLLKTDVKLKAKQKQVLKTTPSLKQQLKLKTSFKTPTGLSLKVPIPRTPKIPTPKIPTIPKLFLLKGAIKKKMKGKKKGGFEEFAFLPDFTSRAIGLDPEIITGKQAQARIRKILTGLETRRGVIIK